MVWTWGGKLASGVVACSWAGDGSGIFSAWSGVGLIRCRLSCGGGPLLFGSYLRLRGNVR